MGRLVALVAAGLLFPTSAFAQISLPVHNTGVDNSDVLVGAGEQTAFWELIAVPPGATETIGANPFRFFHLDYAADSTVSAWVSPAADGDASVAGLYIYQLVLDLTGVDPATVEIAGVFSTDNDGFIRVNGGPDVVTLGDNAFGSLTSFTLNSGFVDGLNSIQVGMVNAGNPTAFRVEFTQATVPTVPEGLLLVFALMLAAGGALMLRRRAGGARA